MTQDEFKGIQFGTIVKVKDTTLSGFAWRKKYCEYRESFWELRYLHDGSKGGIYEYKCEGWDVVGTISQAMKGGTE